MKKVLSVLLALALLTCLFTTALAAPEDVELELKADDGTVAKAVFPGAYLKEGVVNIDGEDREVTAVIVTSTGSLTVDKAVTGTGYLGWDVTPSGLPALEREGDPIKTAAGEHALAAFVDGKANTDSPFYAYAYYEESWGADAVMMYDLITYTAADGSTVYVTYAEVLNPPPAPSDVELDLRADDGTVAKAVFPGAYTKDSMVNIDGEDRAITAVIVDDVDSITVDKAVTGTGYLGSGEVTASGLYVLERGETPIKTAAGEHALAAFLDGQLNTDSPFFDYPTYGEDGVLEGCMMYDLITYTAAGGSTVYVTYAQGLDSQPAFSEPEEPEPAVNFTDVKPTDYFGEAVAWAVENGVTNGTTDTTFSPNDTCKQSQILTFLYRAVKEPDSGTENPYSNAAVADGKYYYNAMLWAASQGVVTDMALDPEAPCTRADVVMYLWLLADQPAADTASGFTDVPAGAPYAQAVAWAVSQKITDGMTKTTFEPDTICTRGQIVTFLHRALAE